MNRREVREAVFKLLFISQFNDPSDMPEQLQLYFAEDGVLAEDMGEGRTASAADEDKVRQKVENITEKIPYIDSVLGEVSSGWKTARMSKVDLSILRLAVYELLFDEEIPSKVAINEAVELCKRFGGEDSSSFVNGILGKLVRLKGIQT